MDFSQRLRELRKQRGLTQEELARELDIAKSSVSMYENGKRKPSFEVLEMFADFFNVNLNEHIETYELIKSAIDTATINGDLNVESDLKRLLRIWNKFMSQAILLRDKAEIYKDNLAMFDGFAEQFYILQDEYNLLNGIQND